MIVAVLTVSAVLLSGAVPTAAGAAPATPAKRKPATDLPATCSPTAITPQATPRARYIWTQLRLAGYSPAASAGVVGYLDFRSSLAPMAIAIDSTGYGIAQWPVDRWQAHVTQAEANRWNRWSLRSQVLDLVAEMATNPGTFDSEAFRGQTDPVEAARVFQRNFIPSDPGAAALAAVGSRAAAWFDILNPLPIVELDPAETNGIPVPCVPTDVTVDRCPMVPDSFKRSFAAYTGFAWDRLGGNTQRLSRCVYTNFPYIASQGTYVGHKPRWSLALDLFMPNGCTTARGRRFTTSSLDKSVGDRLTRYLMDNARKIGLDYLIWQDHIRNPSERAGENYWRPVGYWRQDNYNNGNCTNTHFDHVHVSTYPGLTAASVGRAALNPDGKPW